MIISFDIVGNVSSVTVNVSPTLNKIALHDASIILSSILYPEWFPLTYGVLEKFLELLVTLDANSSATFIRVKPTSPNPIKKIANNSGPLRVFMNFMLLNKPNIIMSSPAVRYTGRNVLNSSIAQAWKCWMARYFKTRTLFVSAFVVFPSLNNIQTEILVNRIGAYELQSA